VVPPPPAVLAGGVDADALQLSLRQPHSLSPAELPGHPAGAPPHCPRLAAPGRLLHHLLAGLQVLLDSPKARGVGPIALHVLWAAEERGGGDFGAVRRQAAINEPMHSYA